MFVVVAALAAVGLLVDAVTAPAPPPTPVVRDVGAPGEVLSMRICEAPVGTCPRPASADDLATLREALADDLDVHRAEFRGQDTMVAEFEARFADDQVGLAAIVRSTLPSVVRVTLQQGVDPATFAPRYLDVAGVGEIVPERLERPRIGTIETVDTEFVLMAEDGAEPDPERPPAPDLRWDDGHRAWVGTETQTHVRVERVPSATGYAVLVNGSVRGEATSRGGVPRDLTLETEFLDPGDEVTVVAFIVSDLPPEQQGPGVDRVDPRAVAAVLSPPSEPVVVEPSARDE